MGDRSNEAAIAEAIRRDLDLGPRLERFPDGSVPVFAADERVLKLFPPGDRAAFETERAALARIDGALSIPTPRVLASGTRDDWSYVLMTRLPGTPLAATWPRIDASGRRALLRDAGRALAELHAVPAGDLEPLRVDWPRFVRDQAASARDRQVAKGLGPPWVDGVDAFLARWAPRDGGVPALLHTEVMREHVLVTGPDRGWRLTGLVDFEPAMHGAREYEFASVGLFLACAEPGLLRAVLEGYGAVPDPELPLRLMAYVLLHRYSNLPWYLERLPVPPGCRDLEHLARAWFTP